MKIFILILLVCSNSFANGFLGNPGKGVLVDDKVFLQDLYSLGIHENPHFGSEILPEFTHLPELGFAYPENLLARKLTDIETAVPGLGQYILASMKVYDWFLIKEDLKTITDDTDPVALPPGALLIQLANRRDASIRINENNWVKMDDANKTALIIHEAVYSFVTPRRLRYGNTEQPSEVAKEVTGRSFTSSFKTSNYAAQLRNDPRSHGLNIFGSSTPSRYELRFKMYFSDAEGVKYPQNDFQYLFKFNDSTKIMESMKIECEKVVAAGRNLNGAYTMRSTLSKYEKELQRVFYSVGDLRQMAVRFFPSSSSLYNKQLKTLNSAADCEGEVRNSLELSTPRL